MLGKSGSNIGISTIAVAGDHATPGTPEPAPVQRGLGRLGPAGRGLIMLVILMMAAVPPIAQLLPRRVKPAGAPPDRFSAERALTHLSSIAREPHPAGTAAQTRVRDYLLQQLSGLGLQPEIQEAGRVENVVARLRGTEPSGAIVVLAHYDSVAAGPGAADNGSGVAALLEVMRALTAGPSPRNDVIVLFDDSEEQGPFAGTRAFIREHLWMGGVRVAIGLDTAVRGPMRINQTGPENGWLVRALARAYTGGTWNSLGGGGTYDYTPFSDAGIQGLDLEDNYPFWQQHTAGDLPEIVQAGSVQQMGEQTLAIVRELGNLDLGTTRGAQETYFSLPLLGFIHYPEAWALPLAIAAGVCLLFALALSLRRGFAAWRGLGVALATILVTAVLAVIGINTLKATVFGLMGWKTWQWPIWPEVIPPSGWLVAAVFALLVLALAVAARLLVRRWSTRAEWSLAGLMPFLVLALALASSAPGMAYLPVWPVLIGALGWLAAAVLDKKQTHWTLDAAAMLAAVPLVVMVMPLLPTVIMGDGMKSLALLAGLEVLFLGAVLPAVDSVFTGKVKPSTLS